MMIDKNRQLFKIVDNDMIYKRVKDFVAESRVVEDFVMLDLSLIENEYSCKVLEKKSGELHSDQNTLKHMFEDTLLSVSNLDNKVKAVILPMDNLDRPFTSTYQHKQQMSPFQFLYEKYDGGLMMGVKIDLLHVQDFFIKVQTMKRQFKGVKIFSFKVLQQNFNDELEKLRKCVKKLWDIFKRPLFHFDLRVTTINGLKKFKHELIINEYPIEYCLVQTNLLELIALRFQLNLKVNWQEICFKYLEIIKKYIPLALGCLLECNYGSGAPDQELQGFYRCVSLLNQRKYNERIRENKMYHKSGLGIPVAALLSLLNKWDLDNSEMIKAIFDSLELVRADKAIMGKYKQTLSYSQPV